MFVTGRAREQSFFAVSSVLGDGCFRGGEQPGNTSELGGSFVHFVGSATGKTSGIRELKPKLSGEMLWCVT